MLQYILLFAGTTVSSLITTGLVLQYLRHKAILDHPNERSSHSIPTPRGGGIGILLVVIPALTWLQFSSPTPLNAFLPVLLSATGLALLSWMDDLYTLGPAIRFISQLSVVSICLYFMPSPENGYLSGFIPVWVEKIILGVGWVWFINLFNFMDGIDGISGVEILTISFGIVLIAFLGTLNTTYIYTGLILAGGALGFLKWNWHKAQVFMGDVGSVPLGFILGWLLILLTGEGFLVAAVIIALYYLSDATITLLKRAARKEKIWQAHREHYYQKATQGGMAHDKVVWLIVLLNLTLLICAWISVSTPIIAIFLACLAVTACLMYFADRFKANC